MAPRTPLFHLLPERRSAFTRRLLHLASLLTSFAVAVWFSAAPARAFVSGEFGLQQRKPVVVRSGPLQYHGGPVIHAADNYAIYWDPLELYNPTWMRLIDGYLRNVGTASGALGNAFALNAQYGETGFANSLTAPEKAKEAHAADQSTFRGAYTDTNSYPTTNNCTEPANVVCLTDQQIKAELQSLIKSGSLPGATGTVPGGQSAPVYYVLTPPGVTVCTNASTPSTCSNSGALELEAKEIKENLITHPAETGICGYHSVINPQSTTPVIYAVQPWVAGYAGLFVESESPLTTSGSTADVLACQDNKSLEEPNQLGYNPFAYYGAGLADVIVGDLANEQSDIAVDPLLNGWYQNASSEEHGYPEQGDMCQSVFHDSAEESGSSSSETKNGSGTNAGTTSNEQLGGGKYYLHWGFNSSGFLTNKPTAGCWQGATLEPHITAPNPVKVGDVVGLDANESYITMDAAPMVLRVPREEVRMASEVIALGGRKATLGGEVTKLEADETKLATEIAKLELELPNLQAEITQLTKEDQRVVADESTLAKERQAAEEAGLTQTEEEEFAAREKKLTAESQRISKARTAAEAKKKTDEERLKTAKKEARADKERRPVLEEDKRIVEGDKPVAEEEAKLANEHRLIEEREPFLAPVYRWDFGYQENGNEVTEEGEEKASVFHAFPCAGTYTVGLEVVDGGGFEEGLGGDVSKTITVEGKPCETSNSGGPPAPGSTPTGGAGSGSTSTAGSSSAESSIAAPVISERIVSTSLRSTLRSGLVASYSVNEQVAGSFNVLLEASIAKRLGLHSPPATGLPEGTPPQEVVGKAVVVTTKGGHGKIKIQFGRRTGTLLRRLHKVSLLLQLRLRSASGATSTALSKITLH